MVNKSEITKLLSNNNIKRENHLKLKYEFPFGFSVPENDGCSILCRIILATLIKSLDYSGSLIGISISSISSIPSIQINHNKKKNKNKNKSSSSPPPIIKETKNNDGEIIKFVQIHCSLSTPIEYSLFHQYLNESLQFSEKEWILEFENILKEIDDQTVIPKLMITTTSINDDICNQWIEFICSIVPPLFDNDKNSYICQLNMFLCSRKFALK